MSIMGLALSDVVNVTVSLTPVASNYRNFGALVILGSSPVIDTTERLRQYTSIGAIATDFGTGSPEYSAALLFFSQVPTPQFCYLGRWAQTATHGLLHGAVLSTAQQLLTNFTAITSGGIHFTIDGGTPHDVTGINFSAALNLNGVAQTLQTALQAQFTGVTVTWDASLKRFTVTSGTTGTTSSVSFATAPGTGTDISALFGLTSGVASTPVVGIAAETLATCVANLANMSRSWYGLTVAALSTPADSDLIATAALIEALSTSRVFGITTQESSALDPTSSSDIASQLMALNLKRTFTQFCSSNPYAATSAFGRAFTVNFQGVNTTITLKFKQEPGIVAESITESQAATLKAKNCNVFVYYENGTAILQEGVMANGYFFDEVHGCDWLQNAIQNDLWNLLTQAPTKIPQTDAGMNLLLSTVSHTLLQALNNGFVAPGVWNLPGFGQLAQGDVLPNGFYVYSQPMSSQSQATREQRIAPPIQAAIKLAGAIHFAGVAVTANR